MPTLHPAVREIVSRYVEVASDDEPFDADSLTVICIVEDLEDELGVQLSPSRVRPECFATVAGIAALLAA